MNDEHIVQLYWERDEQAIIATSSKYGTYCNTIANNILGNREDAEECVNDAYLRAWNSIPPSHPQQLATFLGKIVRNLAINRYKQNRAEKRGGGELVLALDELGETVSDREDVAEAYDRKELLAAITAWLDRLPATKRKLFVCRYWYLDSVTDLAARFHMSENHVSVTLNRLRKALREELNRRGFEV